MNDNRQPTDAENKPLVLAPEHLAALIAHARAAAPNECCGILARRGNAVERVIPLANADASPTTFRVAPADLLAAFEALDAAGLDLVGIYHSHPASPAYPSPTDVIYARGYPGVRHVIVSLRESDRPEIRAFRIDGERINEVGIDVAVGP